MSLYAVFLEYVIFSQKTKRFRTHVKRVEVFAFDGVEAMERAEKLEKQTGLYSVPIEFSCLS